MSKKIQLLIVFIMLIYGTYLIYDWNDNHQLYEEGDTLKDIEEDDLSTGDYVSFYIDDYVKKEISSPEGNEYSGVSKIYVEEDIEYEIYTLFMTYKSIHHEDLYIQVMVKDEETKRKLKNGDKVYFQGQLIEAPFDINKDWYMGTDEGIYPDFSKLISNLTIKQMDIPDEGYGLHVGIVLVILAVVGYCMLGGIKGCLPDIEIKPNKFTEYSLEYGTQTYNIRNEWMCEKDNLKNLYAEQDENKKACIIMFFLSIIGVVFIVWASLMFKFFGIVFLWMGIGCFWTIFINSSNKVAVYIAKSRGKRSIYLEIEECKKNIEELERIMDKKNIFE